LGFCEDFNEHWGFVNAEKFLVISVTVGDCSSIASEAAGEPLHLPLCANIRLAQVSGSLLTNARWRRPLIIIITGQYTRNFANWK
jgi:hypothetical protein